THLKIHKSGIRPWVVLNHPTIRAELNHADAGMGSRIARQKRGGQALRSRAGHIAAIAVLVDAENLEEILNVLPPGGAPGRPYRRITEIVIDHVDDLLFSGVV